MTSEWENNLGVGPEPIALIGIGCTLPGRINSKEDLLAALRDGRDLITEIPRDRWSVDAFYDEDPLAPGKTYVRKGGFLEEPFQFDPAFFGITDAEAAHMDPQQRLVLQTVWHALEDADLSAEELMHSNTGMFLGMMNTNDYSQLKRMYEGPMGLTGYDGMGDAMSITAGRVSHFLGLEGPCMTLDTACSSSLVALHLARQSILAGDCDMAIVAGVNVILHPAIHIAFSKIGLMSRAGRCATFDASADGYIRGEGCMAVVLRRQSQAVERGDRIIASIVGTAVNQDGRTPALTAPNGRAQEKVIRSALARVGINPVDIGYVEAHGTGTPVGDPIEMSAIVNVYGPGRQDDRPLFVGSAKSNFGHIEAGAGLLGLAKAALSIDQGEILPSIHFTQLNPDIDLGTAPVHVATQRIPWPRGEQPRLAGVNSFGYSGTNAHAILQESPFSGNGHVTQDRSQGLFSSPDELVLISARSAESLSELVDSWIDVLSNHDSPLSDIAFTAALGRTHLNHRLAIVGKDKDEISQKLRAWRDGRTPKGMAAGQLRAKVKPKVAFMFTGQGAQYAGMGAELYRTEPHFARAIDRVASAMEADLGAPLREVLFGERSAEYLQNTRFVQPAMFAIEYALAELLRRWGIEPDYLIGHSVGEIVAACFAGILDLEDAARFVVARGRLMGELPPGGKMLAISASLEQVQRWVEGREADVAIATINGPRSVVVSGKAEAVDAIGEIAQAAGRQTKELEVSHAFHSPLMDPVLDELSRSAASMRMSPPRVPIVSNTTGDFFTGDIQPEYWSSQMRHAVLFYQGMEKIIAAGCSLLIEIGPHPALIPAVVTAFDSPNLQTVPTLRRDKNDSVNILNGLASLYVNGIPLRLDRLYSGIGYHRVSLPLYPFRHEKYSVVDGSLADMTPEGYMTLGPNATQPELPQLPAPHPLLGRVATRNPHKTVFETSVKPTSPWADHRALDKTIFPATGFLDMAARGFSASSGQEWLGVVFRDVTFEKPLLLSYEHETAVDLTLEAPLNGIGSTKFTIAANGDGKSPYCRGRVAASADHPEPVDITQALSGRKSQLGIGPFYGELRMRGLEYGAKFANIRELWQGEPGSGEAFGRVSPIPMGGEADQDPFQSSTLLDSCLQVTAAALATLGENRQPGAFFPASLQSVTLYSELPSLIWSRVKASLSTDGRAALVDVLVFDDTGRLVAQFEKLELRLVSSLTDRKTNGASGKAGGRSSADAIIRSREHAVGLLRPMARMDRVSLISRWLAAEIMDTMGQAGEGLNLDKLPPSTAFLEIGLDSLLVTELQRRIQEKLEFRFKPMQGLDYQSIESLAEYIIDEVLSRDLQAEPSNANS